MPRINSKHAAVILLGALICLTNHARADDALEEMRWVLTGDSVALDRSTKFLAHGYAKASIRHANRVLQRNTTPLTKLLANHNLCIAWHLQGNVQAAQPFCRATGSLPIPELKLQQIKSGMYRVKRTSAFGHQAPLLSTIMVTNLTGIRAIENASVVASATTHDD